MNRDSIRLVSIGVLAVLVLSGLFAALVPIRVSAATGDFVHETTFAQDCSSGIGVGITYDGADLWYSCYASGGTSDLIKADPLTGAVLAHYDIEGGLGSLAYDSGRDGIWAAQGGGSGFPGVGACVIALIPLNSSKLVDTTKPITTIPAPSCQGIVDGLAYDSGADQLYWSPDVSFTIWILTATTGAVVTTFPPDTTDGGGCGNSGVGLGGNILYEGFDGCSTVVAVDKATHAFLFKFSTKVATDPNFRDESLTCDPNTFASSGQQVMWSKEAYSPMRAHAYEIPAGSCGFGGNPVQPPSGVPQFPGLGGFLAVFAVLVPLFVFMKRGLTFRKGVMRSY
ncbi:MAG: hypothetical protein JRN52_00875 [Nitrososphaerota archaeon]|nr:hypothetical protein [Nitrososphaerota archaeon]